MKREFVFFHIHIPKCAGKTFQEILERNFNRPNAYYHESPIVVQCHKSKTIEETIKNSQFLEVFSSHNISLDLPFYLDNPKVKAITFVRDPVEKFISHYYYRQKQLKLENVTHFLPETAGMNLDEYIDYALVQGKDKMALEGQFGHLNRQSGTHTLDEVKKYLKNLQLYMFPMSRFDESCLVMEKEFPEYFNDCSYTKINTGQWDKDDKGIDREKIKAYLNPLDFELVKAAEEFLDSLIEKHFGNQYLPAALINYKRRCQEFAKKKEPVNEKDKIIAEKKEIINKKDKIIAEKKKSINEKDKIIAKKKEIINKKDKIIAEKKKSINEKDKIVAEKKKSINEKDKIIASKKEYINEKDKIIARNEELIDRTFKSYTWKTGRFILFPAHFCYRWIYKAFKKKS